MTPSAAAAAAVAFYVFLFCCSLLDLCRLLWTAAAAAAASKADLLHFIFGAGFYISQQAGVGGFEFDCWLRVRDQRLAKQN